MTTYTHEYTIVLPSDDADTDPAYHTMILAIDTERYDYTYNEHLQPTMLAIDT